jgi:hypothetical protein
MFTLTTIQTNMKSYTHDKIKQNGIQTYFHNKIINIEHT